MDKEINIIMCEGASDLAITSLYVKKIYGYEFITYNSSSDLFNTNDDKHSYSAWYKKDDKKYLLICSVGGCARFNSYYDSNIRVQIENRQDIKTLVVITDKDQRKDAAIISGLQFNQLHFMKSNYSNNIITNEFGQKQEIQTYLKIIPDAEVGCLETELLKSMKLDEPEIIESSVNYIEKLNPTERRYIQKTRVNLKAKMGVAFSLLDPEHTFSKLEQKFEKVNLDTPVIKQMLKFLETIL